MTTTEAAPTATRSRCGIATVSVPRRTGPSTPAASALSRSPAVAWTSLVRTTTTEPLSSSMHAGAAPISSGSRLTGSWSTRPPASAWTTPAPTPPTEPSSSSGPATAAATSSGTCPSERSSTGTRPECAVAIPPALRPLHSSSKVPLLVGAAVTGPQLHEGAVGGAGPGHIQAQPGLHAGDGAVGVESPPLVGPAVTRPDVHLGPRTGLVAVGVQAHLAAAAVDGQLPRGGLGPDLVRPAVAVPDIGLRTR